MARQRWGSKLGVILAVAGSAIGLGNFLRFPSQVAQHGGGAFMVPYLVALLLLGLPLMWVEWTIGRFGGGFGHSTAPGMFHTMANKRRFLRYFGAVGVFGPLAIMVYYTYIESWLLGYSVFALAGKLRGLDAEGLGGFLNSYLGVSAGGPFHGVGIAYAFFLLTFALNIFVVAFGIRGGIERLCNIGVPVLCGLAVILLVRVFTLGTPDPALPERNVIGGLGFMWNPDWSALKEARVWLAAAGQIFFTLSVGIGVILTYASYLKRDDDVALSGLTAAAANEAAEVVLGGSIVIPAAFVFLGAAGAQAAAQGGTFNLGFITMPLVLGKLPFAELLGCAWFLLLFIAGITSSVSLAQPAIAFLEDEFDLPRRKAVFWFAVVAFVLCQPFIFLFKHGVVDEWDFWVVNLGLVGFGLLEVILFGWVFGMDKAWTELHAGSDITIPRVYRFVIRYVTPLLLIAVLGWWLATDGIRKLLFQGGAYEPKDLPYVIGTRAVLVGAFGLTVWLVHRAGRRRDAREKP